MRLFIKVHAEFSEFAEIAVAYVDNEDNMLGVASCVTARYYKGLAAHGDNLVIVENV